jgi:hypothetical protein
MLYSWDAMKGIQDGAFALCHTYITPELIFGSYTIHIFISL